MTGQFDATRPSRGITLQLNHLPLSGWPAAPRNGRRMDANHISNSVGPSTLGLFTGQRDPKERAVKPGSHAGHHHRLDLSAAAPTGCCSGGNGGPAAMTSVP